MKFPETRKPWNVSDVKLVPPPRSTIPTSARFTTSATAGAVSFRDSSLSLGGVGREFRAVFGDAHLTYGCR
jgi:hypothetical protein